MEKTTGYRRALLEPLQWGQKGDHLRLAEFERLVGHLETDSSRKLCVVGARCVCWGGEAQRTQNRTKKEESLSCVDRSPWESWGRWERYQRNHCKNCKMVCVWGGLFLQ